MSAEQVSRLTDMNGWSRVIMQDGARFWAQLESPDGNVSRLPCANRQEAQLALSAAKAQGYRFSASGGEGDRR